MKVLLTGATGGIGRYVLALLRKSDCEVVTFGRSPADNGHHWTGDITDVAEVRLLMAEERPDVVIHLAARSAVKADGHSPCSVSEVNVLGTHHLLEYAPEGCRFVFASSATVYGTQGSARDPVCEQSLLLPNSAYGATKAAGEALVNAYTAQGRVRGVSLRLVANAGAGSTHGLVHDVVRKLRSPAETLDLIGEPPGSCKPLLYAGDSARAVVHFALANAGWSSPLNISPLDSIAVGRVADVCREELGIDKPVRWLGWGANWKGDSPYVNVHAWRMAGAGFWPEHDTSEGALRAALADIKGAG